MKFLIAKVLLPIQFVAGVGLIDARAQNELPSERDETNICRQSKSERDDLIGRAEREQFNVRHVELLGNTRLSGRELFKKTNPYINEGDVFTTKSLETAIKSVSKIRTIYPLTLEDVKIRLDELDRSINVLFCVKEKPKR